jgi:hypothetical protein
MALTHCHVIVIGASVGRLTAEQSACPTAEWQPQSGCRDREAEALETVGRDRPSARPSWWSDLFAVLELRRIDVENVELRPSAFNRNGYPRAQSVFTTSVWPRSR